MILVLDTNFNVLLINRKGCEIIGYTQDEVIGKNWIDNFLPKRLREQIKEVGKSIVTDDQKSITHNENPILTKDGEERIIAWNNTTLYDSDKNAIGILTSGEDITEKKSAQEKNIYLANYDALTDLPNRTFLNNRINYLIKEAQRRRENITIMLLDLDHFKDINDTLGHNIGDSLLIDFSKRLKHTLRGVDTIARLGGDEFILLLPHTQEYGADIVAQKIKNITKIPFKIEKHELRVTTSIGIAIFPKDGTDFKTLYKNVDSAMYRAKQDGRDNYRYFTNDLQLNSARNLQISNAMAKAVKRGRFRVVYQPQISLKNGEVIGAEALIRWDHHELGSIPPSEFIPIAENNGLILPIGEWVLKTVIHQIKQWHGEGIKPVTIAVNISAVQFRHIKLPEIITSMLKEANLNPKYIELELTESVAMHNPKMAIETMNNLHKAGIQMSIDDFGTGYSSLSYLKRFKISKLKIDQSFVKDINTDEEDKAIVRTIINMSKSLGFKTIAEGVETLEQLSYLKDQGCDEIQGYYYSKPLPAEEFKEFLKDYM